MENARIKQALVTTGAIALVLGFVACCLFAEAGIIATGQARQSLMSVCLLVMLWTVQVFVGCIVAGFAISGYEEKQRIYNALERRGR